MSIAKKFSAIGLGLGLVLGIVPLAYAQELYVNGTSETSVGADLNGSVGTDVDADVNANVEISAEAETGMEMEGEETDDSEMTTGTNANAGVQTGVSVGGIVSVTRASASSEGTVTITSPASVRTSADLSAYATGVVKADEKVERIEASDVSVSLIYKVRAKLFGFVPIFMNANATVDASGETTVSYPWYSFLATVDSASSLESDIKAATAGTVSSNANAALSVATQAELLSGIHAAMKNSLEASLAAEAATNAEAAVN